MRRIHIVALGATLLLQSSFSQNLMPMPLDITRAQGVLIVDSSFTASIARHDEPHVVAGVQRFLQRLTNLTGMQSIRHLPTTNATATLNIVWEKKSTAVPSMREDESYSLEIGTRVAVLNARNRLGVVRGLETFLQLVELGEHGFQVPCLTINDAPRFPWRGLLIDACRHWMPVDVIKRNLDGMAMVKMNVLHWHLSEDQGFRVESRQFPKLHELGSDGNYYTQGQIKEVVAYAAERGIRVVPEFDMPGHATSWFVGYPELASAPGPYEIERTWGVFDPAMDPSKESTYRFLDRFIGEMSTLFPDEYFHIGGDEVNGKQWDANPEIIFFRGKKKLKDNHALQAYFNRRVLAILKKYRKRMIGWDEILHPDLPKDIVVQSWRGQKSLGESARKGYSGILSAGYNLDNIKSAAFHYAVDPMDSTMSDLSIGEQQSILGGEACMWAEYVSHENIDSRIWPRTAAIAERLWSSSSVKDAEDMYRRLEVIGKRLELVGLTHRTSYVRMLERLAGNSSVEPLKVLADVVEPVENYERGRTRKYTSLTPLNRLVDAVRPESDLAREFETAADMHRVEHLLRLWANNHAALLPIIRRSPLLHEIEPLSKNLSDVAAIGLDLLTRKSRSRGFSESDRVHYHDRVRDAETSFGALQLMIIPRIKKMVADAR